MILPTAIILVAGRGIRILPFSKNIPKCLLPIRNNNTILDFQLKTCLDLGIKNIIICVGYKSEMIAKRLSYFRRLGLNISTVNNKEYATTNTLFSFALTLVKIKKDYLLLNGDVLFDKQILVSILNSKKNERAILAVQKRPTGKEEIKVCLTKEGKIIKISKKIRKNSFGEYTGLGYFPKKSRRIFRKILLSLAKSTHVKEYYEFLFQEAINKNILQFYSYDIGDQKFIEIDTKSDYEKAQRLFRANI